MSDQVFANMKTFVSGATGTISRAICQRIVDEGGCVILLGRNEELLREAVADMGSKTSYHLLDIDDEGIILMCSGVGNTVYYPRYCYGSSAAAAIEAYAHHIAGELALRDIPLNVISPGWTIPAEVQSDRIRYNRDFTHDETQVAFNVALDSPMHETISPEEFADALVFTARAKH